LKSSIHDLVERRYSCRTYVDRPIEALVRQALSDFLTSLGAGPLGTCTRFLLVAATEKDRESLKGLGTYGFIKGASGFVVGAVEPGPRDMEDYGYGLEQAVLAATDLGLGTCWLGGSFTKSSFARKIGATRSEVVPAVVAVGYPEEGSRVSRTRERAGSDRRLPREQLFWEEKPGEPLDFSRVPGHAGVLEAVRWAPSASNKQPWRLLRSGDTWHFYLQRTKGYGNGSAVFSLLRLADLQRVDMGIAMCHFEFAAREHGLTGRWVIDQPAFDVMPAGLEYTVSWIPEVE
jgi:Putative TM nitroreductase